MTSAAAAQVSRIPTEKGGGLPLGTRGGVCLATKPQLGCMDSKHPFYRWPFFCSSFSGLPAFPSTHYLGKETLQYFHKLEAEGLKTLSFSNRGVLESQRSVHISYI
jgi:hypothetical protein